MSIDQGNQHGPRVDEQLAKETGALTHGAPDDGRTERRRDQVGGDEEPTTTINLDVRDLLLERRAELAAALAEVAYPTRPSDLVEAAEHAHLPGEIVAALEHLPASRTYLAFSQVWSELGGPDVDHWNETESSR